MEQMLMMMTMINSNAMKCDMRVTGRLICWQCDSESLSVNCCCW